MVQKVEKWCIQMRQRVIESIEIDFNIIDDILRFEGRVYIPHDQNLRNKILIKMHSSYYITYPKSVKRYQDLMKSFWWLSMKNDVAKFTISTQFVSKLR